MINFRINNRDVKQCDKIKVDDNSILLYRNSKLVCVYPKQSTTVEEMAFVFNSNEINGKAYTQQQMIDFARDRMKEMFISSDDIKPFYVTDKIDKILEKYK